MEKTNAGTRGGRWRATKIVATLGPSTESPEALRRLLMAGVAVVRLNAAHARAGEIRRRVALVRKVERTVGRPVGVLLDLGGPKIRLGTVPDGPVPVAAGETARARAPAGGTERAGRDTPRPRRPAPAARGAVARAGTPPGRREDRASGNA